MNVSRPLRVVRDATRRIRRLDERTAAIEIRQAADHDAVALALARLQSSVAEMHGRLVNDQERAVREADGRAREIGAAGHHRHAEIRDTLHMLTARRAGPRATTRVVFLVHHIEAWDSLHDLVSLMRESPDFEPLVISIPRRFNGSPALENEPETHDGLVSREVPHLRFSSTEDGEGLRMLKSLDPDLLFRQSQWDADIPDDFATARLTFSRLCLVPYEMMNIIQNPTADGTLDSAVDAEYHRRAWAVFCANEMVASAARRHSALQAGQFHVSGHPKADRLLSATPRWPMGSERGRRSKIVWSAHHSIGSEWSNFGTFPWTAGHMLRWAETAPETDFVFMPHPALIPFTSSPASPLSRPDLDDWMSRWEALPNTHVLADGDYANCLAASDLLVTDGLSMLIEYQAFLKPIVFLERPDHRPFNRVGELVVRGVHAVPDVETGRAVAERVLLEGDPLRPLQADTRDSLLGAPGAARRILDLLRTLLAQDAGRPRGREPLESAPDQPPGRTTSGNVPGRGEASSPGVAPRAADRAPHGELLRD